MIINGQEYNRQQMRDFHERRLNGLREEDRNPDDCRCGRQWYPRYKDPLSKHYAKICPGCSTPVDTCTCLMDGRW